MFLPLRLRYIFCCIAQDADRIRRDSVIKEEVPKILPESVIAIPEPDKVKIEIAKPGLVTEELEIPKDQNNDLVDYGIRAEALYDYQAGIPLID